MEYRRHQGIATRKLQRKATYKKIYMSLGHIINNETLIKQDLQENETNSNGVQTENNTKRKQEYNINAMKCKRHYNIATGKVHRIVT